MPATSLDASSYGAMQGGEEIMAVGGEGGDRAVAQLELLHEGVVARSEEPDGALLAFGLGGHGAGVAVLDTVETQYHRPVRFEGGPELVVELARRRHGQLPRRGVWRATTAPKRSCRIDAGGGTLDGSPGDSVAYRT
jgi:hypothetical protein